MRLKRTRQCAKCPWRKDVNPHTIPNGYTVEKHCALSSTIAEPGDLSGLYAPSLHIMACHESDKESWMMLLTASVPRNSPMTISAKNINLVRRICSGNNRRIDAFRSYAALGLPMRLPVPVDMVYFQERNEVLAAAGTTPTQNSNCFNSGVIVITPLPLRCLEAVAEIFPSQILSLPNIGAATVSTPPSLYFRFGVTNLRSFAAACLASTVQSFSVGTELIEGLRFAASRAFFHQAYIQPSHCLGWLMHQLGPGNNIPLRIAMRECTNLGEVRLIGEQHKTFEDTLPVTKNRAD